MPNWQRALASRPFSEDVEGISRKLIKSNINKKSIVAALREVFENDSYSKETKKLKAMIQAKPIKPEQLLVRWTEFAAQFGTLENLAPYGAKLGFIQYYQIDVVAFLLSVLGLILYLVVKLLLLPVRLVKRLLETGKAKSE